METDRFVYLFDEEIAKELLLCLHYLSHDNKVMQLSKLNLLF